jgi:hypothetical protein
MHARSSALGLVVDNLGRDGESHVKVEAERDTAVAPRIAAEYVDVDGGMK